MKIPFNLEKYNTGKYDVITRGGRKVRIICTNMSGACPIVVLIKDDSGIEEAQALTIDGVKDRRMTCAVDLLLVIPTIIINGIEVPAPECKSPTKGTRCYVPAITKASGFYNTFIWNNSSRNKILLERGLIYLAASPASIHTKAILGIKE